MDDWERLTQLWHSSTYATDFDAGFDNGRAFFTAADALNGRLGCTTEMNVPVTSTTASPRSSQTGRSAVPVVHQTWPD